MMTRWGDGMGDPPPFPEGMKVTVESDGDQNRITITYDRHADDPTGALTVLARSGRLGRVLREYARADYTRLPESADESLQTLRAVNEFTAVMDARFRRLLLAGRDWHGLSWGQLADAAGTARRNITRWVQEARAYAAAGGTWFDASGMHCGGDDDHARARANVDAQKTRDDED